MPTYFRYPSPLRKEFNRDFGGIVEVMRHYSALLPERGWREVHTEEEAELVVGHLGTRSKELDVFHLHGLYPTGMMPCPKTWFGSNGTLIDNLLRARRVIAVSDWVAESLRRDLHMQPWVLPHGFDMDIWDQVQPTEEFNRPYVLWNKTRNWGVCDPTPLLDLARRMPELLFVTTLLPQKSPLTPRNVKVTGVLPREQAWRIAKGCAIYLATTKETFGVAPLEAMASGAVVVGYNWGATPGNVDRAGIFVEPGNLDALEAAVREAIDRREELGDLARQRIKEHFTWGEVVNKLSAFYAQTLREKRAERSPRVSVVIPCFNYGHFVTEAIQSVREQTFQDWELIIVDDGSTDDSHVIIKAAIKDEPRARLLRQTNQGVAHARNKGIAEARAEFICCLDADDAIAPTYLGKVLPTVEADRRMAIGYSGITVMSDSGLLRDKVHAWPHDYDPKRGLEGNQVPTCCIFRKEMWKRAGGYRQRFAPFGAGQEDADLWFRILSLGGKAKQVTREGLFWYRFHKGQTTRVHKGKMEQDVYRNWHPFVTDGKHPMASKLAVPERGSWPVRDYDRPRIAIVVPVGPGHERLLLNALDSVEAQTYRFWELIVVNDTGNEIDLSGWPFAKLIDTGEASMGPGRARNLGTAASSATLVVYLDADDVLQPTFLEDTLRLWLEVGGWIYTDFFYIKQDGTHKVWQAKEWDLERLWTKGMAAVTCLYPYQAWKDVGGFDEKIAHEDWEFHIKLALAGWCGSRLAKPLITYRHDTGTRRRENIAAKGFKQVKRRYTKESLMGCNCSKGGGVKRHKVRRPPVKVQNLATLDPAMLPARADNSYKLMMYVGKSKTDLVFKGRSGKIYIFSTQRQLAWIAPSDVGRLARKSVLRLIEVEDIKAATAPELQLPRKETVHESINL